MWCNHTHGSGDEGVGQPLCPECYDYVGHVLFTWHLPELWRRFTITLRRHLNSHLRALGDAANSVRLNYVKVAEMQRRAIPDFDAVIRLDAPREAGDLPTPPVSSITATELAMLVQRAARTVPTPTPTDPRTALTMVTSLVTAVWHPNRHPTPGGERTEQRV